MANFTNAKRHIALKTRINARIAGQHMVAAAAKNPEEVQAGKKLSPLARDTLELISVDDDT